ncbi:acyl-CoA dehydrogenase NM domain-like protein [Mycena epipterygia]|nr:acyl-CoA dehydrogenase NM domain-like protein [Mycena epipterygia]
MANSPQIPKEHIEQVQRSIAIAQHIASTHRLTLEDIETLSPRFWQLHRDPIICSDGAATTLLTIQLNLVIGTILDRVGVREDIRDLLDGLLSYRISGQFCLTEVDHGLDAANIETTATALPSGRGFVLNSPHIGAAKYMPPTIPCGLPCVAVVMARLVQAGVDCGVKPFLVPINDGKNMCPGVTARLLPPRGGTTPVLHALTTFDRVFLAQSALLEREPLSPGSPEALSSGMRRLEFLLAIRRVAVGSLALSGTAIPALAKCAYTAALYSRRRRVASSPGRPPVPIMHFVTQQAPILTAFAQAFVLDAAYESATKIFVDEEVDFRVRHGVAAALKVVSMRHGQEGTLALSERCGAQGLFDYNQMSKYHAELRGIAIAEGDLLGLSIRLAMELALGRYSLPPSTHPDSPLAHHEQVLLASCQALLGASADHRSDAVARRMLPRCQPLVDAAGVRFAYDAARDAGIPAAATNLYRAVEMRRIAGHAEEDAREAETRALEAALPFLDEWMARAGVRTYVDAPIASAEGWAAFVKRLPLFSSKREKEEVEPLERSRL